MEAEAITRLTEGLQPPAIRAILVQCLTGAVAPSVAISRLLAVEGATTVRVAIDDVEDATRKIRLLDERQPQEHRLALEAGVRRIRDR